MPVGMDMKTKLRAIREAKGWQNQGEAAEFFHVTQPTISRWLSGEDEPEGGHRDQINSTYKDLFVQPGGIEVPERIKEKYNRLSPEQQRMVAVAIESFIDALAH
jgi:transcriptional regulator with XRE-family HTH domain